MTPTTSKVILIKVKRLRRTISHQERPLESGTALPPSLTRRADASDSLRPDIVSVAGTAPASLVATRVSAIVSPALRRHGLCHPCVGDCSGWEKAQFRYFASESGAMLRRLSASDLPWWRVERRRRISTRND